jgi:hypothetical protein
MIKGQMAIYTQNVMFGVNRFPCVIDMVYDTNYVRIIRNGYDGEQKSEIVSQNSLTPLMTNEQPVMAKQNRIHWWSRKTKYIIS